MTLKLILDMALRYGEEALLGGEGQIFRFRNFCEENKYSKFQNNFIAKNRGLWNWYIIYTDLEGPNPSTEVIANSEVTPGIMAILKSPKITIIFQGEPPVSDARAIICEKKLTAYVDFVIKYFMSAQNIGENKVGVKCSLFFSPSL